MFEKVLKDVQAIIDSRNSDFLLFRGHSNNSWQLMPSLGRKAFPFHLENILYYDFIARAGILLQEDRAGWSQLFAMRHHGLPTRLLDWTTTFAIALYFSIREGTGDAAVWVLEPYDLNRMAWGKNELPTPNELESDYYNAFIIKKAEFKTQIVTIAPILNSPRMFNQHAVFTLHANLKQPLETLYPAVVKKIIIPENARKDAERYLRLTGISEYSLFPDLDGLARDLIREHNIIT